MRRADASDSDDLIRGLALPGSLIIAVRRTIAVAHVDGVSAGESALACYASAQKTGAARDAKAVFSKATISANLQSALERVDGRLRRPANHQR
jgi:hypothetical protein